MMTLYQIRTRIIHFFVARHWRGSAIHSPRMYGFVRQYAIKNRGKQLIKAIDAPVFDIVAAIEPSTIFVLREPFRSRSERQAFNAWRAQNHAVTAHFQGLIVVMMDEKLKQQHFVIRN